MATSLKCPSCGTKLSTSKHYDAVYEWFECPKCEGCFTYDEILEGGGVAVEEVAEEAPKAVKKKAAKPEPEQPKGFYRGHEIESREVVNIMADEIQLLYAEIGAPPLNDPSAQDKALQLVRTLRMDSKVKITEGTVKHVLCEAHAV